VGSTTRFGLYRVEAVTFSFSSLAIGMELGLYQSFIVRTAPEVAEALALRCAIVLLELKDSTW
jgi:hypothetical protein